MNEEPPPLAGDLRNVPGFSVLWPTEVRQACERNAAAGFEPATSDCRKG